METRTTKTPAAAPLDQLGRYEILSEIGQGAMGVVYVARDPTLDRRVALKTVRLNPKDRGVGEYRERFRSEAQSAGRLSHPNIVTIYDFGEVGDIAYIAMELLEGETLRELLDHQRFSVKRSVRYALQIADGLAAAHTLGVIHRDIKPSNIVRLANGILKITDFGIAQLPSSDLTQAGAMLGTPRYMAPEQIRSIKADPRSEVFALGVVLYEMLTGRVPFDGNSLSAIMYQIVNEAPPDPRRFNEHVSAGLSAIVGKCLAKSPAARYQTMSEFARALRLLDRNGIAPNEVLPTFQAFDAKAVGTEPRDGSRTALERMLAPVRLLAGIGDRTVPLPLGTAALATPKGRQKRRRAVVLGTLVAICAVLGVSLLPRKKDNAAAVPTSTASPAPQIAAPVAVESPAASSSVVSEPPPSSEAAAASSSVLPVPVTMTVEIGGSSAGLKKSRKKVVPPAPAAPTVVDAAPAPVEAPAPAPPPTAAPVAPPPPSNDLAKQVKQQHDCLVLNRCDQD
jgi:serine/threonine-protein kinase